MTELAKTKKNESATQLAGALNKLNEKDIAYLTGYADGVLSARPPEEKPKDKKE